MTSLSKSKNIVVIAFIAVFLLCLFLLNIFLLSSYFRLKSEQSLSLALMKEYKEQNDS